MGPRQNINNQIKEVVKFYFKYYKRKEVSMKEIQKFEKLEEPRIQYFAHDWIKGGALSKHADRQDIKKSLRKQLRETILKYLKNNQIKLTKDL